AAGSAPNVDDIAAADDAVSLAEGGGLTVKIGDGGRVYLYTDGIRTERIGAKSFQDIVPGIVFGKGSIMELRILKSGAVMYSEYHGGAPWGPSIPLWLASPGVELHGRIQVLTT